MQSILKGFSPSSVSTNPSGSAVAQEIGFCFNSMFYINWIRQIVSVFFYSCFSKSTGIITDTS